MRNRILNEFILWAMSQKSISTVKEKDLSAASSLT